MCFGAWALYLCLSVLVSAHRGAFAGLLSLVEILTREVVPRAELSMSSFWCGLCSEQAQEHFLGNVSFSLNIL